LDPTTRGDGRLLRDGILTSPAALAIRDPIICVSKD
jgi:hypothetical protein